MIEAEGLAALQGSDLAKQTIAGLHRWEGWNLATAAVVAGGAAWSAPNGWAAPVAACVFALWRASGAVVAARRQQALDAALQTALLRALVVHADGRGDE